MNEESMEKLQKLVIHRKQRNKISGGEVFALWGVLNLITFYIYLFLIESIYVWVVMIIFGILIQTVYARNLLKDENKELFWTKNINNLWIFLVILIPIIFYVFPILLNAYQPVAIFPIIALWLSLGMYLSGMLVEQKSMLCGSAVFILSSLLMAFFPTKMLLMYPFSVLFGLIIPGIWSKYEEKSR